MRQGTGHPRAKGAAGQRDDQTTEIVLEHPGRVRVRVAVDEQGRRRNRLETQGRTWAERHGIRVPRIVDHDPTGAWLVSEEVASDPRRGKDYVDLGLAVAERIAGAQPLATADATSGWRAPSRGRVVRATQLWRGGIHPRQFLRDRGAALGLPAGGAVHGDLYDSNVLYPKGESAVVIDWEHAGTGPRHHDEIRFLTTLSLDEDAEYALECLLRRAARSDREAIGIQLRWLSLRHYADQIVPGPEVVPEERVREVERRWLQATQWADEIARPLP